MKQFVINESQLSSLRVFIAKCISSMSIESSLSIINMLNTLPVSSESVTETEVSDS